MKKEISEGYNGKVDLVALRERHPNRGMMCLCDTIKTMLLFINSDVSFCYQIYVL